MISFDSRYTFIYAHYTQVKENTYKYIIIRFSLCYSNSLQYTVIQLNQLPSICVFCSSACFFFFFFFVGQYKASRRCNPHHHSIYQRYTYWYLVCSTRLYSVALLPEVTSLGVGATKNQYTINHRLV